MSHTEEYKGYTINIKHDTDADNPFESWDCEPPIAVYSDRGITEHSTQYGNVTDFPYLSREQMKKALPVVLEVVGLSLLEVKREAINENYPSVVSFLNERLADDLYDLYHSDRLEALCNIYNAIGWAAVCKSVHGCSQGDYAEVLAVATPKFVKACGNGSNYDWIPSLEQSIKLFGYWAFGDVYGYTIDELDNSCWGFYGDYPEYGGAIAAAKSAIDWHIETERKAKIERVKTWIRNRVPLTHRIA